MTSAHGPRQSGASTTATFKTSATRGQRLAPVARLPDCANPAVLSWLFAGHRAISGALTAAVHPPLPSFLQHAGYWQTAPVQRVPFPAHGDPARRWAHGNSCKPSPYGCPPRRRIQNSGDPCVMAPPLHRNSRTWSTLTYSCAKSQSGVWESMSTMNSNFACTTRPSLHTKATARPSVDRVIFV